MYYKDQCGHIWLYKGVDPLSPRTTCNFHQTNTLKCTNVESSVKLNTKKVVLLHEHTLRDVYTTRLQRYRWCVAQSHASHTIMSISSRCDVMKFSEKDSLLNFYANFVLHRVQIWVLEPLTWWNKRECLAFQKSEVGDWHGGCAHSMSWHIVSLEYKELATDLAHDGSYCWVWSMLMVIRVG